MSQNSILELEFKTDTGLGNRANIGIIVLRTDQTLEHEFSNFFTSLISPLIILRLEFFLGRKLSPKYIMS